VQLSLLPPTLYPGSSLEPPTPRVSIYFEIGDSPFSLSLLKSAKILPARKGAVPSFAISWEIEHRICYKAHMRMICDVRPADLKNPAARSEETLGRPAPQARLARALRCAECARRFTAFANKREFRVMNGTKTSLHGWVSTDSRARIQPVSYDCHCRHRSHYPGDHPRFPALGRVPTPKCPRPRDSLPTERSSVSTPGSLLRPAPSQTWKIFLQICNSLQFSAMHIPDGFLSNRVAVSLDVLSGAGILYAARRLKIEQFGRMVPVMGVLSAFVFAAQMLNFPVFGGTSGHFAGARCSASCWAVGRTHDDGDGDLPRRCSCRMAESWLWALTCSTWGRFRVLRIRGVSDAGLATKAGQGSGALRLFRGWSSV